ncbi:hypothetical protein [Streptomyces sp. NPDC102437]|uniref:hypothetical protein n=1 Tax=Streptomyces sp. NPDC102437 TaxID=3366175 RepID=UPI0038301EC5
MCQPIDSGALCSFDVTSPDFLGINEGTIELVTGFMNSLGICIGEVERWTVSRFASPYFANDRALNEWQSLFGLAWRFSVKMVNVRKYRPCGGVGPYPAHGVDSTWRSEVSPIKNERERCIVIAAEGPDRDFSALAKYAADEGLEIITYRLPHADVREARVDLGEVLLPESIEVIEHILKQSKSRFMTTHWSDATERTAWQKSADWVEQD